MNKFEERERERALFMQSDDFKCDRLYHVCSHFSSINVQYTFYDWSICATQSALSHWMHCIEHTWQELIFMCIDNTQAEWSQRSSLELSSLLLILLSSQAERFYRSKWAFFGDFWKFEKKLGCKKEEEEDEKNGDLCEFCVYFCTLYQKERLAFGPAEKFIM